MTKGKSRAAAACAAALSVAIAATFAPSFAQDARKLFGGRAPRTCASHKGALNAATAKQYFICDAESITGSNGSGWKEHLVSDVTVEVGSPRPFNIQSDTFDFSADYHIDPAQPVYPIRGGYTDWLCVQLGEINGEPGKNCTRSFQKKASGICFKSSFGEFHCTMMDINAQDDFPNRYPPPAQP